MRAHTRVALVATAGLIVLLAGAVPAFARTVDRNHNKIPDSWEKKYHLRLKPSQANKDFDGDGLSNLNEYLAGTNPRLKDTNHNGVQDGLEDRDKDGLVNLAEVRSKTNIKVADTDHDGVIDSLEDPDGDGLDNAQEFDCATNPLKADTNGDGINDGDEDADEDGLTNSEEFIVGTDPRMADTNNDGIGDAQEDPDGDGLDNRTELDEGTDPCDPDTDHDGVKDGQEIRGLIQSYDPETGVLTIQSLRDDAATYDVVVGDATVLKWAEADDESAAPTEAPTVDDLQEGAEITKVKTELQPDGSLRAVELTIVPEAVSPDPGPGADIVAEVSYWDPESSILTLADVAGDGEYYDVTVDDSTTFAWADGTTSDHDAGVDDLIEGTGVAAIDTVDVDDGSVLATRIVLVPADDGPSE